MTKDKSRRIASQRVIYLPTYLYTHTHHTNTHTHTHTHIYIYIYIYIYRMIPEKRSVFLEEIVSIITRKESPYEFVSNSEWLPMVMTDIVTSINTDISS
jgi:hypothetical protein